MTMRIASTTGTHIIGFIPSARIGLSFGGMAGFGIGPFGDVLSTPLEAGMTFGGWTGGGGVVGLGADGSGPSAPCGWLSIGRYYSTQNKNPRASSKRSEEHTSELQSQSNLV